MPNGYGSVVKLDWKNAGKIGLSEYPIWKIFEDKSQNESEIHSLFYRSEKSLGIPY